MGRVTCYAEEELECDSKANALSRATLQLGMLVSTKNEEFLKHISSLISLQLNHA